MKNPRCNCRRAFNLSLLKGAILPVTGFLAHEANAAEDAGSPVAGTGRSAKSHLLDAGAGVLQSKPTLDAMNAYLNGFHFYADDMNRQVEAHHFCTHLTEDFHQCVIFDSNAKDARLIGIEYIVSERLFLSLPEEEKKLWHSHAYEVKSGELIAPGIPDVAEHALMQDLVSTYGKTWHTWQVDQGHQLPLGIPQLMMGFTRDGQVDAALVQARDDRLKLSTSEQRKNRGDIATPAVAQGANAWERGKTIQLQASEVSVKNLKP
ncbi:OBAP family protein [Achromobacter aloeverae]|uniref:DUF1264 domain-containing protein n=1 Tax=Achromobacter aloeverae TaxID=1750518 RepID=A0A4Q1HJ56_9BURK|nr:OBAP family protein [Achromobacter aloeverae]RXN88091.1 DUF1264 domain-containing protein [Achromobacter aloeverae]